MNAVLCRLLAFFSRSTAPEGPDLSAVPRGAQLPCHLILPVGWEILSPGAVRPAEMCPEDTFSALKGFENSEAAPVPTNSVVLAWDSVVALG